MKTLAASLTALFLASAGTASAEATVNLDIFDVQIVIEMIDGEPVEKRVLSAVASPVPGDLLAYQLTVTNTDSEPATDLEFHLTLDQNLAYQSETFFSTLPDAGVRFIAAEQDAEDAAGQVYLNLKALQPQENGTLGFDVVVN